VGRCGGSDQSQPAAENRSTVCANRTAPGDAPSYQTALWSGNSDASLVLTQVVTPPRPTSSPPNYAAELLESTHALLLEARDRVRRGALWRGFSHLCASVMRALTASLPSDELLTPEKAGAEASESSRRDAGEPRIMTQGSGPRDGALKQKADGWAVLGLDTAYPDERQVSTWAERGCGNYILRGPLTWQLRRQYALDKTIRAGFLPILSFFRFRHFS